MILNSFWKSRKGGRRIVKGIAVDAWKIELALFRVSVSNMHAIIGECETIMDDVKSHHVDGIGNNAEKQHCPSVAAIRRDFQIELIYTQ